MAKPAITKRQTKGSALTYSELDTNFQNLRDATINFTDGTNTLSMDLNDTVSIEGESVHNLSVTVNEAGNVIAIDNELCFYTKEPMGFENRTDSTISFSAATRTFSIQPTTTSYRIWTQGYMRIKTATETKQIPNTSDLYYFYFDSNGDLQYGTSVDLSTQCLIASVQWNAADGDYYFFGEERHGITMDWATHEYLNKTQGLRWVSGLVAQNYTTAGTGSSNADAQIDLTNGELLQEDIKIEITHSNSPTYASFQQDMQGPGGFPVTYHSNATGQWRKDVATDYPVKQGTARIKYNLFSGGTWTTPDASNNAYVAMWLVATANIKDGPVVAVMGQREDVNIGNAQDNNTWASLNLTNFPGSEVRPLYRLIFKTATAYANTPHCYLADIVDYRTTDVRISGAGGVGGGGGVSLTSSDLFYLGENDNDTFQFFTNDPDKNLQLVTNWNGTSSVLALGTTNGVDTSTSLQHGPSVGSLQLSSSTGITLTSGANNNITVSPNGTGKLSVNKAVYSSVSAGTAMIDAYANNTTYANGATVDFANFSGMVIINRQDAGSGNVALWLCGSGATVKLGDSIGNQSGVIASEGSINGYRWTNNTGGTISASFAAIRTRTSG